MQSKATTVDQYLKELPDDRRDAITHVRDVILKNLPEGYVEVMNWGMIAYEVPLATYPNTYNKKPLLYAALASQKNHMAVYLSAIYANNNTRENFEKAYKATGKKMDTGKCCVRFKRLEQLPVEVIGQAIASCPLDDFIQLYEEGRQKKGSC